VLANLGTSNSENVRAETSSLRAKVSTEANEAAAIRAEAEAKVRAEGNGPDVKSAAQGKLGAAVNVIAAVRNFIDDKSATMTADEKARAEARLAAANDLVVQGQAKLAAGAYAEAFNLGNAAIRTAQSVHMLLDVESNLDDELNAEQPEPSDLPEGTERPEASRSPSASTSVRSETEVRLHLDF